MRRGVLISLCGGALAFVLAFTSSAAPGLRGATGPSANDDPVEAYRAAMLLAGNVSQAHIMANHDAVTRISKLSFCQRTEEAEAGVDALLETLPESVATVQTDVAEGTQAGEAYAAVIEGLSGALLHAYLSGLRDSGAEASGGVSAGARDLACGALLDD